MDISSLHMIERPHDLPEILWENHPPDALEVEEWKLLNIFYDFYHANLAPPYDWEILRGLMYFAKDKGNECFRAELYPHAHHLYYTAICMANTISNMHHINPGKEFCSQLFSNLAAAQLKQDWFHLATDTCAVALKLNPDNLKAYYRIALAYKGLHNYSKAVSKAQEGRNKAKDSQLLADVTRFTELIDQLTPQRQQGGPATAGSSMPGMKATGVGKGAVPKGSKSRGAQDEDSWLKDTNVHVTKKMLERKAAVKTKKVKKSKAAHASNYRGKFATLDVETEEDTSDESEEESGGRNESLQEDLSFEDQDGGAPFEYQTGARYRKAKQKDFGMGLDNFMTAAGAGSATNSAGKQPDQSVAAKEILLMHLPEPLDKYDFRLACSTCFEKRTEGMFGSRYQPNLPHPCARDFILCQSQTNGLWLKVRPQPSKEALQPGRNMSSQWKFGGKFRLCQQYQANLPCKIGEPNCTFAHNEIEIKTWTYERTGSFKFQEFMMHLRKIPAITLKQPRQTIGPTQMPGVQPEQIFNQHPSSSQPSRVQPQLHNFQDPQHSLLGYPPMPVMHVPYTARATDFPFLQQNQQKPQQQRQEQHQQQMHQQVRFNGTENKAIPRQVQGAVPQGQLNWGALGGGGQPPNSQPHINPALFRPGVSHVMVGVLQQDTIAPQVIRQPTVPLMSPRSAPSPLPFKMENISPPAESQKGSANREFPLAKSHDFCIICRKCMMETHLKGYFMINIKLDHKCEEDILLVRLKGQKQWLHVRERLNHRKFWGRYVLCRFYTANPPSQCTYNEEMCSFAHNREEQYLWGLEKDERFDIQAFIINNRAKEQQQQGFRPDEHFRRHSGSLRFICRQCFYGLPCRISVQHQQSMLCTANVHEWQSSKLLVHVNVKGTITPIMPRPFVHKTAYFLMCDHQQFCRRQKTGRCNFAHSSIERDVWNVERDTELSRDELVAQAHNYHTRLAVERHMQQSSPLEPSTTATAPSAANVAPISSVNNTPTLDPVHVKCPYRIIEVCEVCWKKGDRRTQKGDRCDGPGNGHRWQYNNIYLLIPQNKILRPLPHKIPINCRFTICRHISVKRSCDYANGYCQYAHCHEEVEVWTWMVKNKVRSLEELARLSQQTHDVASTAAKTIQQGQTVVAVRPTQTSSMSRMPQFAFNLQSNVHYCQYCSQHCRSKKNWEEHCASEHHMFNVNSDKEHQWNYRQPSWGVHGGNYQLCPRHQASRCQFSNCPDMYNMCQYAHSSGELDEWKERWRWRQMKREIARTDGMYSYMESLLEEYDAADSGVTVMSEKVEGVTVTCGMPLKVYKQEKKVTLAWNFKLKTKGQTLERVGLLYNRDRLHFRLIGEDLERNAQLAQGSAFLAPDLNSYTVQVSFEGGMFGSFMQVVAFDFGSKPVLIQKINVELGSPFIQDKVKHLRQKLSFDRWSGDNCKIVRFDSCHAAGPRSEFYTDLLRQYKAPTSADTVINQQSVGVELNKHNYIHKMHTSIYLEEISRHSIIASYNLKTEIELQECIYEDTHIYALPGELFVRVPLNGQLSEDTNAGSLILSSVTDVLIAPIDGPAKVVYEAVIVQKKNFDYDGRGRDYIYLCLSPRCSQELGLQKNQKLQIEIQFRLSRDFFCRMHKAVDLLENNDLVFPDLNKVKPNWNEHHYFQLSSRVLNEDQMKVVRHIVAERVGYTPPLVVYGPFGTGKTETLAQSTMVLVTQRQDARVLICTQSNSAADLYITKHFHAFITQDHTGFKVLRVYDEERRINTVPQTVQKYCKFNQYRTGFKLPSVDEVKEYHVVITTLGVSLYLTDLCGLKGYFTHIFIDEAAQVLECEAIMPLALATETTCVVLTGDHMQMGPRVYSSEAKNQRFHRSLLERLYRHYDNYKAGIGQPNQLNILLRVNYRSKMEIVRFLSAIFYGGPNELISGSNQPTCEDIVPLTFYTAQGREVQDADSTSYYNMAEVEEVVERVEELYNSWPKEWGPPQASSIGVVTPYYEQVNRLRAALRTKRLGQVVVDRVMNFPGREFRAVIISTVRTRHLMESPPQLPGEHCECDGEVGDFGFLSDNKLLNTAMTRAQSLVAVVGDPVALCAIGQSMNIWRAFLKHCQQMQSIYPSTVTIDSVRTQVTSIMNSPQGPNLIKLAQITKATYDGTQVVGQKSDATQKIRTTTSNGSTKNGAKNEAAKHLGMENGDDSDTDSDHEQTPFDIATKVGFFDDWSMDYKIEPDEIIKQLAKESLLHSQKKSAKNAWQTNNQGKPKVVLTPTDLSAPLKIECVKVKQQEGHAVVHYNPNWVQEARRRKLLSANDAGREFDSDSDSGVSEEEGSGGNRAEYTDYTQKQLQGFIQTEPTKYKHCILKIESSRKMYAIDLDPRTKQRQIQIGNRQRCGRAFNSDEVAVEVKNPEDEDIRAQTEEEKKDLQGSVVGILRRAINPKYRMFVCSVEQGNTGVMVPLNRGIPKMFNLETSQRHAKAKKGHVIVYTFTRDKEIIFHHHEPVDPTNQDNKLFIVRYLKWEARFCSPLCVVVGVLLAGTSIQDGMAILNLENYIPKKFKAEVLEEVERQYPSNFRLPDAAFHNRADHRDKLTFTIDPPDSKDLDDALSVEKLPDGNYLVGVHIADVSYFVKPGSRVDMEARNRGLTYYPVGHDSVPMLPEALSMNLCSLKPSEDRLTLSIFLTVSHEGVVRKMIPQRGVIRTKARLTYNDVEDILCEGSEEISEDIQESIFVLQRISETWRQKRLGNGALYQQLNAEDALTPKSHMLVEELMIMTNHQVAVRLLKRFPKCTPLRTQMAPNELELQEWRQAHQKMVLHSVAFTRPFLPKGQVCRCLSKCKCISAPHFQANQDFVDVVECVWQKMQGALEEGDTDVIQSVVMNPELHPQLAVALLQLRALQERGRYVCSATTTENDQYHYSLNLPAYTHFTSPIRRYIDLAVHRLVCASIDSQPSPYSQHDLQDLCTHCADLTVKASRYEQDTHTLHLTTMLQEKPLVLYPVVQSVDDLGIALRFPTIRDIAPHHGNIRLNMLDVARAPVKGVEQKVTLTWQKRIYDLQVKKASTDAANKCNATLNTNRFVVRVPAHLWHMLLNDFRQKDHSRVFDIYDETVDSLQQQTQAETGYVGDVTSEVGEENGIMQHYCEFHANLNVGTVLQVQVGTQMYRGLLAPQVKLLSLSPTLDVCLEHTSNPVRCFAGTTTLKAAKQNYGGVELYRDSWLPLLRMEAAVSAMQQESAVIHNVPVRWHKQTNGSDNYRAVVIMPQSFCEKRQIKVSGEVDIEEEEQEVASDEKQGGTTAPVKAVTRYYDYMCIRYSGVSIEPTTDQTKSPIVLDIDTSEPVTWVGHCLVTQVTKDRKNNQVTIHVDLHQSSVSLPEVLLKQPANHPPRTATIEWIAKPLPHRRMEKAVCDVALTKESSLVRDIALGRYPAEFSDGEVGQISQMVSCSIPQLNEPNTSQQHALQNAVRRPFSLIQGPPGTGKTITGVRLAYIFAEINRQRRTDEPRIQPQVLYCGPSNKSVDVVAGYLKCLGPLCPKLVRVYSEQTEHKDFPLPQSPVPPRFKSTSSNGSTSGTVHKDIALHYLIRRTNTDTARIICELDKHFRDHPKLASLKDVMEYQQIIRAAEIEMLKTAEIILCTCSASSSPKIQFGTNVRQLIIDECGMCTEPEALVPIVCHNVHQVVLIGDHQQLRPIVLNDTARMLGLERSMFERYSEHAKMLTVQYRMHEAIAAFPSSEFYQGHLECGLAEQYKASNLKFWPGPQQQQVSRQKPIAFIHVVGREERLLVSTTDGSEQSKSNAVEATEAVKAATMLARRYHVKSGDIVVLSQYRSQCNAIRQQLNQKGQPDTEVCTVVASQGSEWDYVILSTVRSMPKSQIEKKPTRGWLRQNLGFITDQNQINVAITRARKGLIIIGNRHLLRVDPMWKKLLEHYKKHQKISSSFAFMSK